VLRRGLAKDPAKRFPSVREFAVALSAACAPRPSAGPMPRLEALASKREADVHSALRPRAWRRVVVGVVVGLAAVGLWVLLR
jgi:hypothetical protein